MYFLQSAFKSIKKNYLMTFASVFVLMACMLIIGSAYVCSANISTFMDSLGEKNQIVAYIREDLEEGEVSSLKLRLMNIPHVTEVKMVTKDVALAEYQKSMGEDGVHLSWFYGEENPLRDEFRIQVDENHLDAFDDVLEAVKKDKAVDNTSDSQDVVDMMLTLQHVLDVLGFWIMVILALVSWFIVSNTIKLAMYSRRHEINIMKYVGATNAFIRTPFVFEGVIIGVGSAGISFVLQWVIYVYLLRPLVSGLSFINAVPFREVAPMLAIYFGCIGVVVGFLGSVFSINKYLKV